MSEQGTAGAHPVVLRYVVDTADAKAKVADLNRQVRTDTEAASKSVSTATSSMASAASRAATESKAAGAALTTSFRGAAESAGKLDGALGMLASSGVHRVRSLQGALAGMVSSGLNPMSVALAAVMTALTVFDVMGDKAKKAQKSTEELTASVRSWGEAFAKSADREGRLFSSASGLDRNPQVISLRMQQARAAADLENLTAFGPSARPGEIGQTAELHGRTVGLHVARYDAEVQELRRELFRIGAQIEVLEREDRFAAALEVERARMEPTDPRHMERMNERLAEVERLLFPGRKNGTSASALAEAVQGLAFDTGRSRDFSASTKAERAALEERLAALYDPSSVRLTFGGMDFNQERFGAAADPYSSADAARGLLAVRQELAALETGTAREVLALRDEILGKELELAEVRRMGEATDLQEVKAREAELGILRETLGVTERIAAAEKSKKSNAQMEDIVLGEARRGFAAMDEAAELEGRRLDGYRSRTRGALTGGISDALYSRDWESALSNFASAMHRAVTDALAEGIVDGIQGRQGVFQSIASALGAAGEGISSPPGGAPSGGESKSIVVINAFNENDADAFAKKMSASGAQVVTSKAGGATVSRGIVGGRRRG